MRFKIIRMVKNWRKCRIFIEIEFMKAIVHTAPKGAQFPTKAFNPQGQHIDDKSNKIEKVCRISSLQNFISGYLFIY